MDQLSAIVPRLGAGLILVLGSGVQAEPLSDFEGFHVEAGIERLDQQVRFDYSIEGDLVTQVDALGLAADGGVVEVGYRHVMGPLLVGVSLRYATTGAGTAYWWQSTSSSGTYQDEFFYLERDDAWGGAVSLAMPVGESLVYGRLGYEQTEFDYFSLRGPAVSLPDARRGRWTDGHVRFAAGLAMPVTDRFHVRMEVGGSDPGGVTVIEQYPASDPRPSTRRDFSFSRSASAQVVVGYRF